MLVGTIIPTKYLHMVENDPYHLCLVQHLRERGEYYEFYKHQAQEGKFVTVDSGASEGADADIKEVYELATEIGAAELQLPDVFFDSSETLRSGMEALDYLRKVGWEGRVMAIPQGRTLRDWHKCREHLMSVSNSIDCLGIPKNLVKLAGPMGRDMAMLTTTKDRHNKYPDMEIHLLGCWQSPVEVQFLVGKYGHAIRSVDSGIAAIYAQEGLSLDSDAEKPGDNRAVLDFDADDIDEELLKSNIESWRGYCKGYEL